MLWSVCTCLSAKPFTKIVPMAILDIQSCLLDVKSFIKPPEIWSMFSFSVVSLKKEVCNTIEKNYRHICENYIHWIIVVTFLLNFAVRFFLNFCLIECRTVKMKITDTHKRDKKWYSLPFSWEKIWYVVCGSFLVEERMKNCLIHT